MSSHTSCIVVNRRAEADKPLTPAQLHRVESMLAAGSGGLGMASATMHLSLDHAAPVQNLLCSRMAFSPYDAPEPKQPATSLLEMARWVRERLSRGQPMPLDPQGLPLHDDVRQLLELAVQLGVSAEQAWLLLADWVNRRGGAPADTRLDAQLQPLLATVDVALAARVTRAFEHDLGACPLDHWPSRRQRRILQALRS